jgi:1-acyl-sn-glycerol-3-phosphate acyltransferase
LSEQVSSSSTEPAPSELVYQQLSIKIRIKTASTDEAVVPTAVVGIYEVWPIGKRPRLRGGRVTVRFGPPLDPPAATPKARRAFTDDLHQALVDLSGFERADDFSPIGGEA